MALTIHDQELNTVKEEKKQLELDNSRLLMIASQRINLPGESGPYQDKTTRKGNQETEGQKLERKGGYIDTGELDSGGKPLMIQGMPDAIDPEEHKRLQKQKKIRNVADQGATEGERQAGRRKLKDQTQLPNFLKTIINSKPSPADLLKILQFLPALTGGGLGQMAGLPSSSTIRNRLQPFTKGGPAPYDKEGGSLRDVPDVLRTILLKDAMAQLPANNIRSLQSTGHQPVLDDNNPGKLKIIKQFKPPRA